MLDDVVGVAGVVHREAGAPLGVPHHRGPELGIVREKGIIGCTGEQRDEPQTLLGGNPQPTMLSTACARIRPGLSVYAAGPPITSHHQVTTSPPVLITHRAAKQWCEKFFVLDEVVEPAQPALEGRPATGPVVERWESDCSSNLPQAV